ncbi:fatty acid desaturase 4, chloroplastic-like protein [Tanacetum coccineum]
METRPKLEQLVIKQKPVTTSFNSDDPSLKSTWEHRLWVTTGCTMVSICLASCITGSFKSHIWLEPILAAFVGYILADLATGIYHWAVDNYGNESTPVFGSQIHSFQDHHKPVVMGFIGVFSGCIMFSQKFHAWAHESRSKLPRIVVALQDAGLLISRSQHAIHHRPPFSNTYCIVSGVWNSFLDKHKVYEALEMAVFLKFGKKPRSWGEPYYSNELKAVEASPTALVT